MTEQNDTQGTKGARSRRDRWVKIGFVVVAIALGWYVYRGQLSDPELPGWTKDFQQASKQAAQNDARMVVLFTDDPQGHYDKKLVEETLQRGDVQATLEEAGLIPVHLNTSADGALAEKYGLDDGDTPVLLLLGPDGEVIRRQKGFVTKHTFAGDFLQVPLADVEKDPNTGAGA